MNQIIHLHIKNRFINDEFCVVVVVFCLLDKFDLIGKNYQQYIYEINVEKRKRNAIRRFLMILFD